MQIAPASPKAAIPATAPAQSGPSVAPQAAPIGTTRFWGGNDREDRARDYLRDAKNDAERAADILRDYDDRDAYDSRRNTDIRNDAKNTIDPRALDSLDRAMYELGYPRDHRGSGSYHGRNYNGRDQYEAARTARDAYETLIDATWDLSSYDRNGGRDRPDVFRAGRDIERALDLIDDAEDRLRW